MNRFLIASKAKSAFTVYFFMSSDKGVYVSIYAEVIISKMKILGCLIFLSRQRQSNNLLIWKT